MSKYLKRLMTEELQQRLEGVEEAVLVNVIGLDCNQSTALRAELRKKDVHLLVVKNSLARRATEGTPLAAAFEGLEGSAAICWGSEDFISLVKEVIEFDKSKAYEAFAACGGVMDGEQLTADRVREISKWPNRAEQLSIVSGQISGVGGKLVAQITAPGGAVASQIEQKSKEGDE